MTVIIDYKNSSKKNKLSNLVLFCNEKFDISGLNRHVSSKEYSYILDLIKTKDTKKKIHSFELSSKRKIILVSLKSKITSSEAENLGAKFYDLIKESNIKEFYVNSETVPSSSKNILGYFLHGIKLKSYKFEKYISKKNKKNILIKVFGNNKISKIDQNKFKAIEDGTFYTRDLVSEPGNVLHPDEYAKRINSLRKLGLKINIYDDKKLKKLGMNTLLGVGQGSIRGSYLVTMEWNGLGGKTKPLAFVGKGVCFDTGGISLKPAKFMEDMTYDMAGSAVVVGHVSQRILKVLYQLLRNIK